MTPTDLKRLKDTFNEWAAHDATPDRSVLSFGDAKGYTSRDIAEGVAKVVDGIEPNNRIGKHVIAMVDNYISQGYATLDEVVADLTGKPPAPKSPST